MLLVVTSIGLRKRKLDFSSSDQGVFSATALFANDVQLINAVELLDFDYADDAVQLILCEECGITGCKPGSWASVRRIGDRIIIIPATSAMRGGEWESREYSPPTYMLTKGFPTFSADAYNELRDKAGKFPAPNLVRECTSLETLDLLQITAPGRVLGNFGSVAKLQLESIIAVTEGDLSQEIETLGKLIFSAQDGEVDLHSVHPERVVEFHVDIPGFPTWRPFGYDACGPVLNLGAIAH